MSKIISFLLIVLFGAFLISWLSDHPGFVLLNWGSYEITISFINSIHWSLCICNIYNICMGRC